MDKLLRFWVGVESLFTILDKLEKIAWKVAVVLGGCRPIFTDDYNFQMVERKSFLGVT